MQKNEPCEFKQDLMEPFSLTVTRYWLTFFGLAPMTASPLFFFFFSPSPKQASFDPLPLFCSFGRHGDLCVCTRPLFSKEIPNVHR